MLVALYKNDKFYIIYKIFVYLCFRLFIQYEYKHNTYVANFPGVVVALYQNDTFMYHFKYTCLFSIFPVNHIPAIITTYKALFCMYSLYILCIVEALYQNDKFIYIILNIRVHCLFFHPIKCEYKLYTNKKKNTWPSVYNSSKIDSSIDFTIVIPPLLPSSDMKTTELHFT